MGSLADAGVFSLSSDSGAGVWNNYPSKSRSIEWKGGKDADGYAHGRGVVLFLNDKHLSAAYMGYMRHGKMEGEVVAVYPRTAMCYVGEVSNWSENGHGTMIFSDGSTYQGQWRDGNRHGVGTQWARSGELLYQGYFENDKASGDVHGLPRPEASFAASSGIIKKYKSSQLHWHGRQSTSRLASGYGVVVSRDNEGKISGIYHGFATEGKMSGEVVAIYAKVRQAYVGAFSDWSENGEGQMFYPDGTTYVGRWVDATRQGLGTLYAANGNVIHRGRFVGDELVEIASPSSAPAVDLAIQPIQSEPVWEVQNWRIHENEIADAKANHAWKNITGILLAQKMVDWSVQSDSDELGALFSLFTKYYARGPAIDENLRVIYPDLPNSGIFLIRNVLCALVDGTFTLENLSERTLKSELIAAAQREGASEGHAAKIAAFTYDALVKMAKIQRARQE